MNGKRIERLESTMELHYDVLDGRISEIEKNLNHQADVNEAVCDILEDGGTILEQNLKYQADVNKVARDIFDVLEDGGTIFEQMDRDIRFLKKLVGGLVFAVAGLTIGMLKTRTHGKEIRNVMNEG